MRKILLIDDDTDDADLFQEALTEVDPSATFYRAWEGREAMKNLVTGTFGLPYAIFLDINMPGMNGWQFLKAIKELKQFEDVPVFMYTTSAMSRDIQQSLSLGARCYIVKPTGFEELRTVLRLAIFDNCQIPTTLPDSARLQQLIFRNEPETRNT